MPPPLVNPMRRGARVAHTIASRHALRPAMHALRLARPSTRDGERTYLAGLRFRRDAESWTDAERQAFVQSRLREVVRHASRATAYYPDVFRQAGFDPNGDFDFADFAALPTLERTNLGEDAARMRASGVPDSLVRRDSTGGSTGAPVHYVTGPLERGWVASGSETFMRRIGLGEGSGIALLWAHHLDPLDRSALVDRVRDWVQNVRWYDCLRLDSERLLEYHRLLERAQPDGIVAYAGALAALAESLEADGKRPTYALRALVTGAEKLWAHQRQVIERVFAAPLHERYGSRDVGLVGFQARPRESLAFTVDWANVLVEPETDSAESAILVTKLHADAQPMIRYRIGDVARFPAGAKPGHPSFTIEEIVGRQTDRLWTADGRWMHGLGVPHLMKDFPLQEYQLVQQTDFSVDVRIIPRPSFSASDQEAIIRILRANLGKTLPIRIETVQHIDRPAGKWRPVISHVRNERPAGEIRERRNDG